MGTKIIALYDGTILIDGAKMIIKPYSTTKDTVEAIPRNPIQKKIKFESPKNATDWERTILLCLRCCKLLKSITLHFDELRKTYNIIHKCAMLYSPTSYSIEFKQNTYDLIVTSGQTGVEGRSRGGPYANYPVKEVINERVEYKEPEKYFGKLLMIMGRELPVEIFNHIIKEVYDLAHRESVWKTAQ